MSTELSTATDTASERVNYFSGQLLTADDMVAEQAYHQQKRRRHNRFLHGWGVSCGCDVEPAPTDERPWLVRVRPGYVVTSEGDEIDLATPDYFDLAGDWLQAEAPCRPYPCPPVGAMPHPGRTDPVYLAIRYQDCRVRPKRLHPLGCGCDETACDYTRVRDSHELGLLWELSPTHIAAAAADQAWLKQVRGDPGRPMACPPATDDPWVVLASITLPAVITDKIVQNLIDTSVRRVLHSAQRLQYLIGDGSL